MFKTCRVARVSRIALWALSLVIQKYSHMVQSFLFGKFGRSFLAIFNVHMVSFLRYVHKH